MSNEKKLSWASVGLSSKTAVEFPTLERRQGCKDLKGTTCLKVTGKHVARVFLHRVQTPPAVRGNFMVFYSRQQILIHTVMPQGTPTDQGRITRDLGKEKWKWGGGKGYKTWGQQNDEVL